MRAFRSSSTKKGATLPDQTPSLSRYQGTAIATSCSRVQEVPMNKFSFPLSLISIAVLAACTTYDRATPAPGAVVVEPPKAAAVPAPAGTIVAPVVVAPAPAPVAAPSVVVPSTPALRVGNGRIESIAAGDPASGARGAAS